MDLATSMHGKAAKYRARLADEVANAHEALRHLDGTLQFCQRDMRGLAIYANDLAAVASRIVVLATRLRELNDSRYTPDGELVSDAPHREAL